MEPDANLAEEIRRLEGNIRKQGDVVRAKKAQVKEGHATQADVDECIEELKQLKLQFEGKLKAFEATGSKTDSGKETFRAQLSNLLERRLFYIPSFKIYGGVAGLFDFGPPGCAVKQNLVAHWRQHFVLSEAMLEIECPSVTPDVVLRASGHVDKFTDLMVNDLVTGDCHRADHLLKDVLERQVHNPLTDPRVAREMKDVLARVDEFDDRELGELLKKYDVKAPETGHALSDPYPFNLMFSTSIGPAGNLKGYLRPETAQGMFVNFRDLLYFNGGKLPFAAAQIGQAYRNEIAPRAGLLRVREFTLAEIEHFVIPDRKDHPKFGQVRDLSFQLYPREEQLGEAKETVIMSVGEAVDRGIIANETLAYFIARTYLFLTTVGIDPQRLRFRQHLQHEMAHYACDCWDAEVECSYGWIECVGLADRSAYDLTAHAQKSKVELAAFDKFDQPRQADVVTVIPNKPQLGKEFKKDAGVIMEALAAMEDAEALEMGESLRSEGRATLKICSSGQEFELTHSMVSVKQETKTLQGRNIVPSVIEPSFGIGRILYCMFEHAFYMREGDEQRAVLRFSPVVAPIKCTIFPLMQDSKFDAFLEPVCRALTDAGLSNKVDTTGVSIGKRYARTDELGVPFAVTVDYQTLEDSTVTLRERDTCAQVRMPSSDVAAVVRELVDTKLVWKDVQARYPAQTTTN
eukprot:jgi/Pico_ML_1/51071/g181.t1